MAIRFKDLVRQLSTSVGTGDFTLGAAVLGYRTFQSQLNIGDQFYYSVVNVSKPAETEVGLGTLLAGNKIARSVPGGALTNFTSGAKQISLTVAADWYASVDDATAGGADNAAAIAALQTQVDNLVLPDLGTAATVDATTDPTLAVDAALPTAAAIKAYIATALAGLGTGGGGGGGGNLPGQYDFSNAANSGLLALEVF